MPEGVRNTFLQKASIVSLFLLSLIGIYQEIRLQKNLIIDSFHIRISMMMTYQEAYTGNQFCVVAKLQVSIFSASAGPSSS